jgi:hypothetical protein
VLEYWVKEKEKLEERNNGKKEHDLYGVLPLLHYSNTPSLHSS